MSSMAVRFGRELVKAADHSARVRDVFNAVANRYDAMNDAMSFGLHRAWKRQLVNSLLPGAGQQHLDVAGGTGDVAFEVLDRIRAAESSTCSPCRGHVSVVDTSEKMIEEGRRRAYHRAASSNFPGIATVSFDVGDAQSLWHEDNSFDSYSIAFGLRNVTDTDKALSEALRVLRPGGRVLCMEFSKPQSALVSTSYTLYSEAAIPALGRVIAGDSKPYRYLVDSIQTWKNQRELTSAFERVGFEKVTYSNLMDGIVAIHSGFKPAEAA